MFQLSHEQLNEWKNNPKMLRQIAKIDRFLSKTTKSSDIYMGPPRDRDSLHNKNL